MSHTSSQVEAEIVHRSRLRTGFWIIKATGLTSSMPLPRSGFLRTVLHIHSTRDAVDTLIIALSASWARLRVQIGTGGNYCR